MKKKLLLWILAFIITAITAYIQRVTGPSYPLNGKVTLDGKTINYKLERSHLSTYDYTIKIPVENDGISGELYWRKLNSTDAFTSVKMIGEDTLKSILPKQPVLTKLEYYIILRKGGTEVRIPSSEAVHIRFRGDVPAYVLLPHIIAMFLAMLLSTRSGLEFFSATPNFLKHVKWTLILLFIGGFPLGFLMNYYAFDVVWEGWPFGFDVTDNKTQIAFICWLIALFALYKIKNPKYFVIAASIIMLVVYLIPHSI